MWHHAPSIVSGFVSGYQAGKSGAFALEISEASKALNCRNE